MLFEDIYILKDSDPIEMTPGKEITVNLALEKQPHCYNTILIGRVHDKDMPIANATVKIFDKCFNPLFHANTDDKGIYKFKDILHPGNYFAMASAANYKTSAVKTIVIKPYSITNCSFSLQRDSIIMNGIVYGKVLEEGSNKSLSNAIVCLKTLSLCNKSVYKTVTNENGQYLIYNILPNKYTIEARKLGYMSSPPIELIVEKHNLILLDLNLTNTFVGYKGTVSGMITWEDKPIPNVPVFLYVLDAQGNEKIIQVQVTNGDGFYLFSNVEKGSYVVKSKLQNKEEFERSVIV